MFDPYIVSVSWIQRLALASVAVQHLVEILRKTVFWRRDSNDFSSPFQAQLIAQSIGQAFQVAYMEFLKANGIEDPGLMKEIDYQDVLNQQEIYGEELNLFANKDMHKEVRYTTHNAITVNCLNIRTPKIFVVITRKFELCGSTIE